MNGADQNDWDDTFVVGQAGTQQVDADSWDDTFVVGQGEVQQVDEDGRDDTFVVGQGEVQQVDTDVPDHTVVVGGSGRRSESTPERDMWAPPVDVGPVRRRDRYRPRAVPPLAEVAAGVPEAGTPRSRTVGPSVADDSRRLAWVTGGVLLGVVLVCAVGVGVVVSLLAAGFE